MTLCTRFVITLSFVFFVGCNRNTNEMSPRQAYVVALYDESSALTDAGDKWGRAMEPWFHGNEADIYELVAAYQHFETTIESVRRKFKKRKVPDGPKAKEFAELVTDYLDWQMQIRETYAEWHHVVQTENPAAVATRQSVIDELHALNDKELEWKARINSLGEELGITIGPEQCNAREDGSRGFWSACTPSHPCPRIAIVRRSSKSWASELVDADVTLENKVVLTTAIVVDVEPAENGSSARMVAVSRRLGDALKSAFADDPSIEPTGCVAYDWLNDSGTNFGRCKDCNRLVSDYEKPNQIRGLLDARISNGTLLCDKCGYFRREATSSKK